MPKCDFCDNKALYDAHIPLLDTWANTCQTHLEIFECYIYTKLKEETDDQTVQTVR